VETVEEVEIGVRSKTKAASVRPTFFERLAAGEKCRDPSLGVIRERMTPLPQDDNVGGMAAPSIVEKYSHCDPGLSAYGSVA
jgi:hypothetical protein